MDGLTFGQRIVAFRSSKQMLQRELAEKVGITPTALNYYEKDKREPNVFTIIKLAKVLGVSGDELLGIYEGGSASSMIRCVRAEIELINAFRHLNEEGQEKVSDYADDLVSSGKYIKNSTFGVAEKESGA